jgi:Zn-dependent protease
MSAITQNPATFIIILVALILSIGIHEFAHVFSAYLQGDDTGQRLGRLTLNPLKHLDLYGTMFMVVSMLFGVGIGWGKPAPYNPNNLRFRRWGSFLVAIAGPLSNILLVLIFGYAWRAFGHVLPSTNLLIQFLEIMAIINASLAAFNLLPIPPLDGSRFISAVLGPNHPIAIALDRYGFLMVVILIVFAQSFISFWVLGGASLILRVLGLG